MTVHRRLARHAARAIVALCAIAALVGALSLTGSPRADARSATQTFQLPCAGINPNLVDLPLLGMPWASTNTAQPGVTTFGGLGGGSTNGGMNTRTSLYWLNIGNGAHGVFTTDVYVPPGKDRMAQPVSIRTGPGRVVATAVTTATAGYPVAFPTTPCVGTFTVP